MEILQKNDGLLIRCDSFSAAQTFLCGQCFRFDRDGDGFVGVANGRVIRVSDTDDGVFIHGMTAADFDAYWRHYFDLDRDYAALQATFPQGDAHLMLAVRECGGIRLLNQDPWEALLSFIISQNNNIPRIKGVIKNMCRLFGDSLGDGFYAFPTAERLAGLTLTDLEPLRCGYRAPYILECAADVASGRLDLAGVRAMSYADAKKRLLAVKGIGPKVADCALLFGFGFGQAFPVDTWVKKVMRDRYGDGFDPASFGPYAGFAQQYLFYYERGTRE